MNNRITIGQHHNAALAQGQPITAPITKSIPPHSLIDLRYVERSDGTMALEKRINDTTWAEVPFFDPS